jgi:hypothetical protein
MNRRALLALTLSFAASVAFAHGAKTGVNGGPQVEAGSYHVEALADGTILQVWLRDRSDKPVSSVGFKGTAIFVIGGKPRRIPLAPAGDNKLTGTSQAPLSAALQGAVQITSPAGSTVQAKFE